MTLERLRAYAVRRSLFEARDLQAALDRFGFVQADPIRAPARAQDLTLRHRLADYHAGDLERRYGELAVEEDFFVNYGFVTPAVHRLMHPRGRHTSWPPGRRRRAEAVLAFVRERGAVHPREVDRHFAHGRVTNHWGGSSSATTHLLDQMHYLGVLRIVGRDRGVRVYGVRPESDASPIDRAAADARLDALADVALRKYAPMPGSTLSWLVGRLRYAMPAWKGRVRLALERAKACAGRVRIDRVDWYWPAGDDPMNDSEPDDRVRLLAPFDPIVWDRKRFEYFWGWGYRFEAYTPVAKRRLGYYALPLLWRDRVIGWANLTLVNGRVVPDLGFVEGRSPRDRAFKRELDAEIESMRTFLAAVR